MRALLLLITLALMGYSYAKMQNITVKGTAVCNKKRMANVKVELWEKDTLDPDDLMQSVHTDAEGEFQVYGEEDETTSIAPYLLIHHTCAVTKEGCTKIAHYEIPKSKIGDIYDMTYVPLDIVQKADKEKC